MKLSKKVVGLVLAGVISIGMMGCSQKESYTVKDESLYKSEYDYTKELCKDSDFQENIRSLKAFVEMTLNEESGDGSYKGDRYSDLVKAKLDYGDVIAKEVLTFEINDAKFEEVKLSVSQDYWENLQQIRKQLPKAIETLVAEYQKIRLSYNGSPKDLEQIKDFNEAYEGYQALMKALIKIAWKG